MNRNIVASVFENIVSAGRNPVFYSDWGVPDTPLGRYECIGLHMILFLRRTRGDEGALGSLAQDVVDEFFTDIDHSIRELGIGDQSVPKRMKKLARMFYGRMGPYWEAIDGMDSAALAEAVSRNIGAGTSGSVDGKAIADYMLQAAASLAAQGDDAILSGQPKFPEPQMAASS
jgi:cytochrome b pre-mRNA-processing protein 3